MALRLHLARTNGVYAVFALLAAGLILTLFLLLLPPSDFPRGATVRIEERATLADIGAELEKRRIIRSARMFKIVGRIMRADTRLKAGEYRFDEPQGLTTVLYRLEEGISGLPTYRVTFPEGSTVREMSQILSAHVPGFESEQFGALAREYEGTLFPDTYYVEEGETPEKLIARMRATYERKIAELNRILEASGRSETDLIIMASLLEKEAKSTEDRRIIAGILWDRIEIGMPLQVDAVFGYIKGVDTYHPSGEDLLIDSPYNTYEYRGLPPGPIGNPGVDAVLAAADPLDTPYLYYLSGADGQMHYAATFEEHKLNKERYVR